MPMLNLQTSIQSVAIVFVIACEKEWLTKGNRLLLWPNLTRIHEGYS